MAEGIGTLSLEIKSSAQLNRALEILDKAGTKRSDVVVKTAYDKKGNVAGQMISARTTGSAADIQKTMVSDPILKGLQSVSGQPGAAGGVGWAQQLGNVFSKKNMLALNKNLFMMQMASLGVAFSFQSLEKQILSVFSGLSDIGEAASSAALATAYSAAATGGTGGNILGSMGVTPEDLVRGWLGIQAITNSISTLMNGLAAKILTPQMVSAILTVIDAIANELAKPAVVTAIQDIILAVLQTVLQMIPLLPALAAIITFLSNQGLLGALIAIILIAPYLLSLMSLIGWGFQALILIIPMLTPLIGALAAILGGGLLATVGAVLIVIGAFILILDFVKNLFIAFGQTGFSLQTIWTALQMTLGDVINFIAGIIRTLTLGAVDLTGGSSGSTPHTQSVATTNNYYNYGNLTKDSEQKWKTLG
jgi:hypothetical protein